MKFFYVLSAVVACLSFGVDALFWPVATGATGSALVIGGGTAGTAAATTAVLGGAILLKAVALGALFLASRNNRRRGRRDVEDQEEDAVFTYISQSEPAQCYRRLICELATGAMPKTENEVILSLFKTPTPYTSPKYDFAIAANIGKEVKNIQACEVRYSCPLTGQQIDKLFKN